MYPEARWLMLIIDKNKLKNKNVKSLLPPIFLVNKSSKDTII